MSKTTCRNDPNKFCHLCGDVVFKGERQSITENVKSLYRSYFKMEMSGLGRNYVPAGVCRSCIATLRLWNSGGKKHMPFAVSMIWSRPSNHSDDCYFCSCSIEGFNRSNRNLIVYPTTSSSTRPTPHGPGFPVPLAPWVDQIKKSEHHDSDSDKAASAYETVEETEPDSISEYPFVQVIIPDIRESNHKVSESPKDAANISIEQPSRNAERISGRGKGPNRLARPRRICVWCALTSVPRFFGSEYLRYQPSY
ncbi:hypothetical protein QAD02_020613 [Eretmocerus hayati]|uniref:Uncharacterized protein n=1 Tax=Eretmocerus hayati TaxID=131215 RepID=A0ACC2PMJ6_9HYME|nr:hypothetical protein QAD02_020613 [Eretmocerus hayati]